jgi:ABC-type transport system involved in multi-copper enzyme maturation permease subunit
VTASPRESLNSNNFFASLFHEWRKLLIITLYTFKEIVKSKIYLGVLGLGLVQIAVCYVAYHFTYGAPHRMVIDFGLSMISISGTGMAIFIGAQLVFKEIEQRTIYMVLSRPLKRSTFYLGRVLGLVGIILANFAFLACLTLGLFKTYGGVIDAYLLLAMSLILIESLIMLLIAMVFSLLINQYLTVIFSIFVYLIGHTVANKVVLDYLEQQTFLGGLVKTYLLFFPNLSKIDLKEHVLYQQVIPFETSLGLLSYGGSYLLLAFVVGVILFKRKNLD